MSKFAPNNTLQSKLGFQDEDLKTSKHDEIMLWADANAETILKPFMKNEAWRIYNNPANGFIFPPLPDKPDSKVVQKIWEHPVMSGNFTVGFIDIMIKYREPLPVLRGVEYSHYGNTVSEREGEKPYWDIEWCEDDPFKKRNGNMMGLIALEIKSVLPTIGELVRQIRMYENYLPRSTQFIVVSPDDRFASALQSQGIGFIKYE